MSLLGWDDEDEDDERPPPSLDRETARRVAHSFYLVRMARYAALVVTLAIVAGIAALAQAPAAVVWAVLALVVVLLGLAVLTAWRHRQAWGSASSGSPRA